MARPAAAVATEAPVAITRCFGQVLKTQFDGRADTQCLGRSRSMRSGSVTNYRFEAADANARWLDVDVAGGEVTAVSIGRASSTEFACAPCSGVDISPADLQGARTIRMHGLALGRAAGDIAGPSVMTLNGTLHTDAQSSASASPACQGQDVLISDSEGRSHWFCPGDGTSVSRSDDGSWTYRFASDDGPILVVETTAAGALLRIAYDTMSCEASDCAGVSVALAGDHGARLLQLSSTLVQRQGAWASLGGRLLLPSW